MSGGSGNSKGLEFNSMRDPESRSSLLWTISAQRSKTRVTSCLQMQDDCPLYEQCRDDSFVALLGNKPSGQFSSLPSQKDGTTHPTTTMRMLIAQQWKQPNLPEMQDWLNKVGDLCKMAKLTSLV
ncbi:uncharacterized protein LOC143840007 isoform X2 [Paroedura picta]